MAEEFHAYSGGAWRKALDLWVYNGGVWRSIVEAYVYDGSQWRRCFNAAVVPTLNSANGTINSAFDWDLHYTLSSTAPAGYALSVQALPFLIEAGPFDVSGTTSSSVNVTTDSTATYRVQLLDDLSTPIGSYIDVTPV